MPKWVFLVVLAGCTAMTGRTPAPDAAETLLACEADFDASVVKTCTVVTDCVLLAHADCCGEIEIGIAATDNSAAQAAETRFDACVEASCGARGCSAETAAEDGKVPDEGQTIVATCIAGQCGSTVQ